MSQIIYKADGASRKFLIPEAFTGTPTLLVNGSQVASTVVGQHLVASATPAKGASVTVQWTSVPVASAGSGGGITETQYLGLTQDAELAAVQANIFAKVDGNEANVKAKVDTLQVIGVPVNSISEPVVTYLVSRLGSTAYTGKIEMRLAPNGQATSGWSKLGGVGIPENLFNTIRTALLPYAVGPNGMTDGAASAGRKVTLGDVVYTFGAVTQLARSFNFGTGGWSDVPAVPFASGMYPTVVGTVNGKVIATGAITGSNQTSAVATLDPTTGAWSTRASTTNVRQGAGIADLMDGRCVVFGGKDTNDNTSTTATNIHTTVRVYSDVTNLWSDLATLPVRMFQVRTVRQPSGAVVLFPTHTSDGTTLVTTSRRVFRWTEASGAVELDPIPAEVANTPFLLHARADGTVVYVPTTTPTSGSRARLLNPSAAAGSQWSNLDWDFNNGTTYGTSPVGMESKATGSGFIVTASPALSATFVGVPQANWSQVILQAKN